MSSLNTRLACLNGGLELPTQGLALSTLDHVHLAHPGRRRGGVVLVSAPGGAWWPRCYSAADLVNQAPVRAGAEDQYMSNHSFRGDRAIDRLLELRACHVDLDTYGKPEWRGREPAEITTELLLMIADARLPDPSMVLFTGRGLQVFWFLHPVPTQALPRWQAVQAGLAAVLEAFGADQSAITATTCTRLVGTRNSKSGLLVRPTFLHPHLVEHGSRWTLDDMAEHTLPLGRRELAERKAARQARWQARKDTKDEDKPARCRPVTRCTTRSYWETVIEDLQRLLEHRWGGMLPSQHRNEWLLQRAMAGAWLVSAAELDAMMVDLADRLAGWTPRQTRNALSTVLRRARQAEVGASAERNRPARETRYRPRAVTIVARLCITTKEIKAAGLRVLVDAERARTLATERKRASRRRAGVAMRATYDRVRTAEAVTRARATLALVAGAGSTTAAAEQCGTSTATMRKRYRRAVALLNAGHSASR